MSVETEFLRTHRGDELTVNLFTHAGQEPTVCITIDDADECKLPTFELNVEEIGRLREILRKFGERADRSRRHEH